MKNHPDICNALKFLAGQCDWASSWDGAGFNKLDAQFGHDLADKCEKYNLTLRQHLAALKMLTKYRGQLQNAALALPLEADVEQFIAQRDLEISHSKHLAKTLGTVDLVDDTLKIQFDYNPGLIARIKDIGRKPGERSIARWNLIERHWELPPQYIANVKDALPEFAFTEAAATLIEQIEQHLAAQKAQEERDRKLREWEFTQLMSLANLDAPLPNGRMLYKHQKEGIETIFRLKNLIVADDMGLGKSAQALVAARAYHELYRCPTFVICPASLKENWKREAQMVGLDIEIFSFHHASIPTPLEYGNYLLIFDEAHYCQNPNSQRTQAAIALATAPNCRACILLTGTPLKNGDPMNLFPLLVMMQHDLGRDKGHYKKTYCRGNGSHLKELNRIITKDQPCMIRRTKKQCLDLPPKTRVMREAEPDNTALRQYQERFNALREEYHRRIEDGTISDQGAALVMLTHLRHAASWAKIDTTIELAQEILEQGEQAIIFCAFHDTALKIAAKLDAEIIDGEANARKQTQSIVDRFQEGRTQALVCMFSAGGVGLNLTAASTVILADRPWTPAEAEQSEARIHRIGQHYPTTSIWIQAFETDRKIDHILQQKQQRIDLVLAGKRQTFNGTDSIGSIAKELLEDLFS